MQSEVPVHEAFLHIVGGAHCHISATFIFTVLNFVGEGAQLEALATSRADEARHSLFVHNFSLLAEMTYLDHDGESSVASWLVVGV